MDRIGDMPGAIDAFRTAVEVDAANHATWLKLVDLLDRELTGGGHTPIEGISKYQKARMIAEASEMANTCRYNSRDVSIYHLVHGKALEASGDNQGAFTQYRKALELDPRDGRAIEYLRRLEGGFPAR